MSAFLSPIFCIQKQTCMKKDLWCSNDFKKRQMVPKLSPKQKTRNLCEDGTMLFSKQKWYEDERCSSAQWEMISVFLDTQVPEVSDSLLFFQEVASQPTRSLEAVPCVLVLCNFKSNCFRILCEKTLNNSKIRRAWEGFGLLFPTYKSLSSLFRRYWPTGARLLLPGGHCQTQHGNSSSWFSKGKSSRYLAKLPPNRAWGL